MPAAPDTAGGSPATRETPDDTASEGSSTEPGDKPGATPPLDAMNLDAMNSGT